jgi:tetratricopeptide (TPR) repeat protein
VAMTFVAYAPDATAQSALANCKYYTKTQQDFEQGLDYCKECIEVEPENPEARFFGAWCLAETGNWSDAWTSFEWLIDRADSKDKKVKKHSKMASDRVQNYFAQHFNKGVEYLKAGTDQYPNARDEFRIASLINPRDEKGFLNLGFTQTQLGETDDALTTFRSAREVAPDNTTVYEYLSVALGNKRVSLREADPVDTERLAAVTQELKETLAKVIEASPANDAALLQLGDLNMAEGDTETGIANIRKAIEIDPNNVVKLYNIAVGFYQADEYEAAANTFAMVAAEEDDPGSDLWRDSKYNAALCLMELKAYDRSLELVSELLEANPEEPDYHSLASRTYLKLNDLPKANQHMERYEALKNATVVGSDGDLE